MDKIENKYKMTHASLNLIKISAIEYESNNVVVLILRSWPLIKGVIKFYRVPFEKNYTIQPRLKEPLKKPF